NSIKSADCAGCVLVTEEETAYNYLQVARRDTPRGVTVNLIMNEGQAIQSIRNTRFDQTGDARDLLTGGGPWDYFAVAPYVFPKRDPDSIKSLAMLGSATGTVPAQFLATYGSQTTVDAVEIDPQIIALGRTYFGMRDNAVASDYPNYRAHAQDARYWLTTNQGAYDVIGMDAYRQPYVPFHLTTVEFFQLVRARLTPDGVAVVNAGKGLGGDNRLGQALATTMRKVFPQVFIIETAGFANQILIGVNRPVGDGAANFRANYARMQNPALRVVMDWSLRLGSAPVREFDAETSTFTPFTDDRAPVE